MDVRGFGNKLVIFLFRPIIILFHKILTYTHTQDELIYSKALFTLTSRKIKCTNITKRSNLTQRPLLL